LLNIKDLYAYAHSVRSKFASKLSELPWEEVCKNTLLHIIDNEDWMVNWVIKGKIDQYVRRKWEDYTSIEQVLEHMPEVERKTDAYFRTLSSKELSRTSRLKVRDSEFTLTVEECLLQS